MVHMSKVSKVYSVYRGPLPLQEGKLVVPISPVGLAVHQSKEAALLTFWDLSNTRVIAGKMHNQSPILKNSPVKG